MSRPITTQMWHCWTVTNIKQLVGDLQGSYRLRVGDIRIVYSVDDAVNIVFIEVIGFRGDVYKQ